MKQIYVTKYNKTNTIYLSQSKKVFIIKITLNNPQSQSYSLLHGRHIHNVKQNKNIKKSNINISVLHIKHHAIYRIPL